MSTPPVGGLLRAWRETRGLSQEKLAARAGVSTRHLSFIETGRASPGREVLRAIAGALDVPLREQNRLFLAAGFAPRYSSESLDSASLAAVRGALDFVLRQQEPFPAIVLDRAWNVLRMNLGAARLLARFAPPDAAPEAMTNIVLSVFHPRGLRPVIANWDEVAGHLLERVHRAVTAAPTDEALAELRARVLAQPDVPVAWRSPRVSEELLPVAPVHLAAGGVEARMFTMLSSIGDAQDVTVGELRIETYFPTDAASEALLRSLA
jgi:transcriptional regulator with XRE-family HTH domain